MKLVLFSALFLGATLFAETLDKTIITPIGAGGSTIRRLITIGGGVVAIGDTQATTRIWALARYNAHGELKADFGNGGIVTTALGTTGDYAFDVVETNDGKLIVGGRSFEPPISSMALVRYTRHGAIDTSFGTNGVVKFSKPSWSYVIYAMTLQDDGKIVVAAQGVQWPANAYHQILARFRANGALDTTFGTGGMVTTPLNGVFPHAVKVLPNGKIIIAGHFYQNNEAYRFILQRYTAAGAIDTTFGTGGTVVTGFGPGVGSVLEKILVEDSGAVFAAGSVSVSAGSSSEQMALLHYKANGTLDSQTLVPVGTNSHAMDIIPVGNRVLLAGYAKPSTRLTFALVRFKLNGQVDQTFGDHGSYTVPVGVGDAAASSLVLDKKGRVVVGGQATPDGGPPDFALIRIDTDEHGGGCRR